MVVCMLWKQAFLVLTLILSFAFEPPFCIRQFRLHFSLYEDEECFMGVFDISDLAKRCAANKSKSGLQTYRITV